MRLLALSTIAVPTIAVAHDCAYLTAHAHSALMGRPAVPGTCPDAELLVELCQSNCDLSAHPMLSGACPVFRQVMTADTSARQLSVADQAACAPMASWTRATATAFVRSNVDHRSAEILEAKGMDGSALADLTSDDADRLDRYGLLVNATSKLISAVSKRRLGLAANSLPIGDPCSAYFGGKKAGKTGDEIFVNLMVDKVLAIDETKYEFEAKAFMFAAFREDRLAYLPEDTFESCQNKVFGIDPLGLQQW
jgi:hypothetical protein